MGLPTTKSSRTCPNCNETGTSVNYPSPPPPTRLCHCRGSSNILSCLLESTDQCTGPEHVTICTWLVIMPWVMSSTLPAQHGRWDCPTTRWSQTCVFWYISLVVGRGVASPFLSSLLNVMVWESLQHLTGYQRSLLGLSEWTTMGVLPPSHVMGVCGRVSVLHPLARSYLIRDGTLAQLTDLQELS